MNASSKIAPDKPASLAHRILAGDLTGLPVPLTAERVEASPSDLTLLELVARATAARAAFEEVRDGPCDAEWARRWSVVGGADFAVCARLICREGFDSESLRELARAVQ